MKGITIDDIKQAVSEHFDIPISELEGPERFVHQVEARAIAYDLCRTLTDLSMAAIGREFGDRDHSTVVNGLERFDNRLPREKRLKARSIKYSLVKLARSDQFWVGRAPFVSRRGTVGVS
ncbi:helix-turn-helix domain-containing protein [Roseobacter sp. S98]|uniref:helix-turn-helix domain-containing protein n=1 Tax=Roseobacter algicola (ex Choi et al. 2025) (nom. illeg.) TaxID=3092138 RepID=UPI0035C6D5B3